MSLVEQARERLEEVRTKGVRTALEEKFPKIKEMRGGGGILRSGESSGGNNPEAPALKDIREKGVLGVLAERFPKIKEIREKGLLTRFREEPTGEPEPSGDEYKLRDTTPKTTAPSTKGYRLRR